MSKKTINLNTPLSEEIDMSLLKNITVRNKYRNSNLSSNSSSNSSSNNISSSEIVNKNYILEHYNISICTDSLTNIYINIINKSTYQNYEKIIYDEDLESNLNITKFIKIIYNCFESKPNYKYNYELQSNSINFNFFADFDGFYDVAQSICLMEKEISQDKQLSSKITELESRIRELETKEIIFGFDTTAFNNFIKIKKNIDILDLRSWNDPKFKWYGNLWEFNSFENLKKIILDDNQFKYDYNPCTVDTKTNIDFKIGTHDIGVFKTNGWTINSPNVGNVIPTFTHNATSTTSVQTQLDNMFNNTQLYFPNVIELVFYRKTGNNFNSYTFKSLPNLKKVVFEQYENNLLTTFDFIKNNKITHVIYNNCLNIHQLDLIKNYFETNNLVLEVIKK
jgi:hypothetical protein